MSVNCVNIIYNILTEDFMIFLNTWMENIKIFYILYLKKYWI